MTVYLAVLQTALPSNASVTEIVVGFALTLLVGLNVWQIKTLRCVDRDLGKLQHLIFGVDGNNGLRSDVKDIGRRVAGIEKRNLEIDAIAAIERQQYAGTERRKDPRRLRDTLIPPLPPVDRGEGEE